MAKTRAKNAGRPRKDAPRAESGRLSRAMVNVIEGLDPSTVKRMIDVGMTEARTLGLGTPLGRLMLAGKLTTPEFEAGRRVCRLMRRYHAATQAPKPDPKGSSIGQGGNSSPIDPDSEAGIEEAKEHANTVKAALAMIDRIKMHGRQAAQETLELCEGLGVMPATYEAFLRAKAVLADLSAWWELTKRPARGLN